MRDFDGAMKQLVRAAATDLLPQLGIPEPVTEWLNLELPRIRRTPDLMARLAGAGVLHLELQANNDDHMDLRMLEYDVFIFGHTGVLPRQVLLYFGRDKLRMRGGIDGPGIHYRYTIIDARSLDTAALLASGIAESNLLALLTDNGDPETVVRNLRRHLRTMTSRDDRARLEELFLLLCSLRGHDGRKVWNMPVDAMDIPLVRQYWETGKAEGVAEGKLQGVATGKREGMAELLIHQLECRFGRLPDPARDHIRQASPEQILHWSTAVFTAGSVSELLD